MMNPVVENFVNALPYDPLSPLKLDGACTSVRCWKPGERRFHDTPRCLDHFIALILDENKALLSNLTHVQERCTALLLEARSLRGVVEKDSFITTLVRERDEAVRARDKERRVFNARIFELEERLLRCRGTAVM